MQSCGPPGIEFETNAIHNDGDNQWIVFEYEWVILSRKSTPDVVSK